MKYATERDMEGSYDENGPKQHVWRHLGHRYVVFKFSLYIKKPSNILLDI